MRIFIKSAILKKIFLLAFLSFCLFNLNAQEKSNIKLGIEAGFLPLSKDAENLSLFLNVEPKVKILENAFMGLRFGLTLNSHIFDFSNSAFFIDERFDNAIFSFAPTFDYYWHKDDFHPYFGLGLGYYVLPDPIEVFQDGFLPDLENVIEGDVNNRVGVLLRGGVEWNKFRFGLEYNFIPKGDIEILNGQTIGTVENSYLGLSVGFIFGFRKSSK